MKVLIIFYLFIKKFSFFLMKEILIINFIEIVYSYICVFVIFMLMFIIIYV